MTFQLDLAFFHAGPLPEPMMAPPQRVRHAEDPLQLPGMENFAGYEIFRDGTRTVLRKPGEARWCATIRVGPTQHRFVAAGGDPASLWRTALTAMSNSTATERAA